MNTLATIENGLKISFVSGVALILAACSGDGREFEEAVETKQLDLASISIVQPTGLLDPLFVNPGEQINFSISAKTNESDEPVDLSPIGRRWSVGQPALASIDGNGRFTAIADGIVDVNVQIGGLEAFYQVTVSNATLSTITPDGPESLERCIPVTYSATGLFDDGSERGLPKKVDWSIPDPTMGSVSSQIDGTVLITAFNAGVLSLDATVGDVNEPTTININVESNLQSIDIPTDVTGGVMERSTLKLTATGNYLRDGDVSPSDITESVTWSLADDRIATVSNDESDKGLVTGAAVGKVEVTASCGVDQFATKEVEVIENDGSSNLAFEGGQIRTIFRNQDRDGVQLNVSTGSVYDEENAITTDFKTTWSVSEGGQFVEFSPDPNRKGVIIPKDEGTATIRVVFNDPDEPEEIGEADAFQTIVVKP